MNQDFYNVLGLGEEADANAIKKAYRKLARELHPDRNPDDPESEERFKEVQHAYGILSDAKKRRQYDRQRRFGAMPGDPFQSGRGGQYYQRPDGTFVRMDQGGMASDGGFTDIFDRFFGGTAGMGGDQRQAQHQQQRRPTEAYDRKRTVRISFERMLRGGQISFTLDGEKIQLPFPKGVKEGHRIRIKGKGRPMPNGSKGNLYVTIRINEHTRFWREESNLHTRIEVPVFDAILGAGFQLKTPGNKVLKLTIPAGTQPGDKLRVRGHGVELQKKTGDLIVHIDVQIPDGLSDQQKDLIKRARDAGIRE